jgi:hypothetical protein
MTATAPEPSPDENGLVQCATCGRYGWHETERCPETPIALPAGLVRADDWQHDVPLPWRVLLGDVRSIDDEQLNTVQLTAVQFADGRIDDGVVEPQRVYLGDGALTAAQARAIAAALIEAADEIDGWATT